MERKYGGIDSNWFAKPVGNGSKKKARNWTWWRK
jgi:hypothetical protein